MRLLLLFLLLWVDPAAAQPEVMAWGNLRGIRVDGQLMEFETSIAVVDTSWTRINRTAKERQRPSYVREGTTQIVSTRVDSVYIRQAVEDLSDGMAQVDLDLSFRADTNVAGVFYRIDLPEETYGAGTVELIEPTPFPFDLAPRGGAGELLRAVAEGVRFDAPERQLEISLGQPTVVVIRRDPTLQAYLAVASGKLRVGQSSGVTLTISASGEIDREPVELVLDTSTPGRPFAGLGGNFRIQNPRRDPPVIRYNLDNLRVAWGRVDMPWMLWHPDEGTDPAQSELHPRVTMAMEMAADLHRRGIPVMLAVWFPPEWAVLGEINRGGRGPDGLWGNALNPEKTEQIYASIASYIRYLREHYGVEVEMFSFNESDLGIDVRQTAQEHADLIKGLGAYFASRGLPTKLLLGDTADARGWRFIEPAMADPETHAYIGAVSYHSWRGWEEENLAKWSDAAGTLGVPLIVGEGSIDAGAWRYPAIFEESTYALEEINLYTRILAINQPLSILQWQLTGDYSIMAGGNDGEPLRPTQRFWNLKQLASTPEGLYAMPLQVSVPAVSGAALGDNDRRLYTVHLVNNGPTREAVLRGLPRNVRELRMLVTDGTHAMEESRVAVSAGVVRFTLEATSFTTLTSAE